MSPLASQLKPAERIHTPWISINIANTVSDMSYRKGVDSLNRLLHREEFGDVFNLKTLSDRSLIMGECLGEAKQREADKILWSNGITRETIDVALSPKESSPVLPILPLHHSAGISKGSLRTLFREEIDRFNEAKSEAC